MIERKKKVCKCGCGEEGYIYARGMLLDCDRRENPHKHGLSAKPKTASKIIKNSVSKAQVHSKYKDIYFDFFKIYGGDFVPCEVCEKEAVDIHHIDARGMGGDPTKSKDKIENLMALCRSCHEAYGDIKVYKDLLRQIHKRWIILQKS